MRAQHSACSATYDGEQFRAVALRGVPPRLPRLLRSRCDQPGHAIAHRLHRSGERRSSTSPMHDERLTATADPIARAIVELGGARTMLCVSRCARTTRCSAYIASTARKSGRSPTSRSRCCRTSRRRRSSRWRTRGSSPRRARRWSSRPRPPRCCRSSIPRPATSRRCSMRCSKRRCGCARPHSAYLLHLRRRAFHAAAVRGVPAAFAEYRATAVRYGPSRAASLAGSLRGERVRPHRRC